MMGTHLACITIESRSKLYPFSHHHARNFSDPCTVCPKIHFSYGCGTQNVFVIIQKLIAPL